MKINKNINQGLKSIISSNILNKINQKQIISCSQNSLDKKQKNLVNNSKQSIQNESRGDIPKIKLDINHHYIPKIKNHQRKYSYQHKDSKINISSKDNFNDSSGSNAPSHKIYHNRTNFSNINSLRKNNSDKNKDNNYLIISNLKKTINILLYYINTLNKKFCNFIGVIQGRKKEIIDKLVLEKKFLINDNKKLKIKIMEIFLASRLYEKNSIKMKNKYINYLKQIIKENNYLRQCNGLTKNINIEYLLKLENQVNAEKFKKGIILQKQLNNIIQNNKDNNINNLDINNNNISFNNKDNNESSPFSYNEDLLSSNKHKRQRTHFNLGILNDEEKGSNEKNENIPKFDLYKYYNLNNNNNMRKDDLINSELKEMTLNFKTKKNNSKTNIFEKIDKVYKKDNLTKRERDKSGEKKYFIKNMLINNKENNDNNSCNNENIKKQQSLYYRMFKEKDRKEIDFIK